MAENLLTLSILALGILCIVTSAIARYKNNRCIQACTANTITEVTEIRESDGKKFWGNIPHMMFYVWNDYVPVYRFTLNGKSHEVIGDVCTKDKHKVGETVSIKFGPDDLDNFYTPEDMLKSQKFATNFLIAGIVILGIWGVVVVL